MLVEERCMPGMVEFKMKPSKCNTSKAMPQLPAKGDCGERPAKAAIQAVIARSLIRRRTAAGLEQKQLAAMAGVRAETISRIESGRYRPQHAMMERLDRALAEAVGSKR